jgi:hypothetical protein
MSTLDDEHETSVTATPQFAAMVMLLVQQGAEMIFFEVLGVIIFVNAMAVITLSWTAARRRCGEA